MIVLIPPVYEPDGVVRLREDVGASRFGDYTRRVSRRPTIDGGAWIDDFGFSAGDLIFQVVCKNPTQAEFERLKRWVRHYSRMLIVTRDGVFYGSLGALVLSDELSFNFTVEKQNG